MNLGDFEILPGVVIANNDPLGQGRVKANAPTLFTPDMPEEDLFWINPFCMFGTQSFSTLDINTKIWILHNPKNYFEYWYIPMFEINPNMPKITTGRKSDAIIAREYGGNKVSVYSSEEEGVNICNGNNKINLTNNGDLNIVANKSNIVANTNGIELTKEGEETYSSVKAETLIDIIKTFCNDIINKSYKHTTNPYTSSLASDILNATMKMRESIENIKSDFVKIS